MNCATIFVQTSSQNKIPFHKGEHVHFLKKILKSSLKLGILNLCSSWDTYLMSIQMGFPPHSGTGNLVLK